MNETYNVRFVLCQSANIDIFYLFIKLVENFSNNNPSTTWNRIQIIDFLGSFKINR